MKLVIRQSERSGHQQRLLQAFTKDVFIQLTHVHNTLELSGRCALQIYLHILTGERLRGKADMVFVAGKTV